VAGAGRSSRLSLDHLEIPIEAGILDAVAAGPSDGPLVLLLHGFPESSYEWRHQLPALAEAGYRAVAPDQRGYSPRARPEGADAYHVDHLVADVLAVADHLGGGPFHLVAHDWGAVVGWMLAGRHPDRLLTFTSLSTPHPSALAEAIWSPGGDQAARSAYVQFFRLPEVPERVLLAGECAGLRAILANTGFVHRAAVDEYVRLLCDPAALTAVLNWYRAADLAGLAELGPITTPTLYVWSTCDPALGREAAEDTASRVQAPYQFVVLDGVSHWIPEDVPEDLNPLLLEHLSSVG
jgi:pimeloyl-ACP methyl ester carboxylesterase